jgi:hypothetical protein
LTGADYKRNRLIFKVGFLSKKTSNKFAGTKKRVVCLQPLREQPARVEG